MREGWEEIELGDVITTLKGYAFKSKWYQDNGVAVARVSDFNENSISTDDLFYISPEIAKNYTKYQLKKWDVIIQTVGSGPNNPLSIVGKVICVPEDLNNALLNQNAVKISPNNFIDNRFLYYRLKEEHFKYHCLNHSKGGANQMSITLDSIKRFEFNLPPLKTQRKIASILSAYDDLIVNNLKRIKLLEEQAQQTYEEWFVRFKFPGYETAVFDEESGLPVGWEEKNIEAVCTTTGGGTPSRKIEEYWNNGSIPWFSPTDLSKTNGYCILDSSQKITDLGLKKSSAKILQKDSFMMTSRATIGLFAMIEKPFSTNQGFINVTPYELHHKEYLFHNFVSRKEEFKGYGTGSTFPEISKGTFRSLDIIWPENSMLIQFHNRTFKIHKYIFNLQNQNQLLKEARDILLPRLMSGMIDPSTSSGQFVESLEADKQINYKSIE